MNPAAFYDFIHEQFLTFFDNGEYTLFGGILRKYIESMKMSVNDQKQYICQYLRDGGDIDVYTGVLKIDEYKYGSQVREFCYPHEVISASLNKEYLPRSHHCLKLQIKLNTNYTTGMNVENVKIDIVCSDKINLIKLDFDVNSLIMHQTGLVVIESRAAIDLDVIVEKINRRTCSIFSNEKRIIPKSKRMNMSVNLPLKRAVKMINNGYTIEEYDELCCMICGVFAFNDALKYDSCRMIAYILNGPLELFIKTHKTQKTELCERYHVRWDSWLVYMCIWSIKYGMFEKLQPLIKNFSDFNSSDCATVLFERIAEDHFDKYIWIMNEVGYGHRHFHNINLKYITSNSEALEYMHNRIGHFGCDMLEKASHSSFETFQFVLNRIGKKQMKNIDWKQMSRNSLTGDYRIMKWIKENKDIDPELHENFWHHDGNTFRFELYDYISKEMYSDQFMYKLCRTFKFTPAVLTLEGIDSRITPIFIEWYLNLHYSVIKTRDVFDMMMILDILLDRDNTVVVNYTQNYKMEDTIKDKLIEHIRSHGQRKKDVALANKSYNKNQEIQNKMKLGEY